MQQVVRRDGRTGVSGLPTGARTRFALRAAWVVTAVALVALVAAGFVRAFADPQLVALPALVDVFEELGLSFRLMIAVALALPFTVVTLICALVFWRRSRDPMALLFTMSLLSLYSFSSRTLLTYEGVPVLEHALPVVFALAIVCLSLVLGLFPDGRFVPRWTRWLAPITIALLLAIPDGGRLLMTVVDGDREVTGRAAVMLVGWGGLLLAGLLAQGHRYRHVSGPVERQQTKWVIAPLGLVIVTFLIALAVPAVIPGMGTAWIGWLMLVVIMPVGILMPVMVANAVLRYRLYEIDRIISRTVSYALVIAALAGVYGVGVVALGSVASALTRQEGNDVVVAASVLAAAAVFRPLRRRVHAAVDRRFNRTSFEARRFVEAYAQGLRDEVDLNAMRRRLAHTADAVVSPTQVSVWLADRHRAELRPAGDAHAPPE